jgi:hypothetical protein
MLSGRQMPATSRRRWTPNTSATCWLEMRRRFCAILAALLVLVVTDAHAQQGQETLAPGVFFGGSLGGAVARIEQPALSERWRPGALWELHFGWQLSEPWAVGGQFTTWGTELTLEPVHLHTIGPRLEFAPLGLVGPFIGGVTGLALTEGDAGNRAGLGQSVHGGWRIRLARWATIAGLAGAHGHVYGDGWAALPFAVAELRIHGVQK